MTKLTVNLELGTCPHCSAAKPVLAVNHNLETNNHSNTDHRKWRIYVCTNCGGVVTAWAVEWDHPIGDCFPKSQVVQDDLPERVREFLQQAIDSLHAPAGAVMLSASAVDAMLKEKHYKEGSLYARIDEAVKDGVITADMANWAHEIRLDANDQRHADENAGLPNQADAERCIEFAKALGQFMFVLPARITRGISAATDESSPA